MDRGQASAADDRRVTADAVARQGAQRIAELIKPGGRFIYAHEAETGAIVPGYNLLRHCGSVWSMLVIARHFGDMPTEIVQGERAMSWILSKRTRQIGNTLCITSGETAKLGGCGLGLLALTELFWATGKRHWLAPAQALARFILRCRRDDGDYHHKIVLESFAPDTFRSEYYTGEALLGLIRLYQATGDVQWLDVAQHSVEALEAQDYGVAQKSHWMAYAIAELHACLPSDRWLAYAGRIARGLIDEAQDLQARETAPIATRVEALMAYAAMAGAGSLDGQAGGPPRLEALQVARRYLSVLMQNRLNNGGFVRGPGQCTVQIDYIQHAAHAFLAYSTVVRDMAAAPA